MRKWISTILCAALCAVFLSGCGVSLEGDTSVVYVNKKGIVYSLDVEELDQDFYDETELKDFVDEAVEEYNELHEKNSVKVEKLSIEDGVAKLKMRYRTAEDYTEFNGIELYQGEVVASLAAGYVYDGEFAKVEDGKVTGAATKQEIYADEDLKVVIIRANTDVKIDGEICYVSCENVKLDGSDSVSIRNGYYLDTGVVTPAASESVTPETENYDISDSTLYISATESVTPETESAGAQQEEAPAAAGMSAADSGSFETDVYTFIVYK